MALDKEAILSADDLPREEVAVPEWGGSVWVRTLTAAERDAWELWCVKEDRGVRNIRAGLVVRAMVDEKGSRVFADGDTAALGGKSGLVMDRLWEVARRLGGLSEGDVEELEKNSSSGQGDDSPSD